MGANAQSDWHDPLATRSLYFLTRDCFERGRNDTGGGWATGRLKPGDILLCDELKGDYFYDWYLVDYAKYVGSDEIPMQLVPYKFGAYSRLLQNAIKIVDLTRRDYGLLIAGEKIRLQTKLPS